MLKKLINDPFDAVDEMLEGFVAAHADVVRLAAPRVVARRTPGGPKVGLVIGGGSGHEPAFGGYVGTGLADAAALGNVFAAPGPDVCLDGDPGRLVGSRRAPRLRQLRRRRPELRPRRRARGGRGDRDPDDPGHRRRGLGGAGGARSSARDRRRRLRVQDRRRVRRARRRASTRSSRLAGRANAASASIGVALSPCEVPGAGRPTFEIGPDEIEIGMGVHGEPGIQRGRLEPADAVAERMVTAILADWTASGVAGGEVALLVNGLGATAYLDLYIVYRAARRLLEAAGCKISRSFVGEYVTSLEMAGASITVLRLDDELRPLLDAPARTARLG